MRDSDANDIWAVLRDWLIKHSVKASDLTVDPPKQTDWGKMDNDGGQVSRLMFIGPRASAYLSEVVRSSPLFPVHSSLG